MKTSAVIVHDPTMRDGDATIVRTRITVTDIIGYCWVHDPSLTADDICDAARIKPLIKEVRIALPHVSKAQVEAALKYWQDHPDEIAQLLHEEEAAAAYLEATLPHAF